MELRKARGNKCKDCGTNQNLQFAHIKETRLSGISGRGRKERYYDIKNNPKSYVLICETCHRIWEKIWNTKSVT